MKAAARSAAELLVVLSIGTGCSLGVQEDAWEPAPSAVVASEIAEREPCALRDPLRRPFYGELHLHTAYSMDAWANGTRASPDDAYRFAKGEPIEIFGGAGEPPRQARMARALDFTAVTDHAEWMGEVAICTTPGSPGYDSNGCQVFRGERDHWLATLLDLGDGFRARMPGIVGLTGRPADVCGDDGGRCRARLAGVWAATQKAAERHYDRSSACQFTTFHAWEYSASPGNSKVHRNVILRNELSPELPLSWIDTPTAPELRRELVELCNDTGTGCEAIAIPHNPNLSNGQSFSIWYAELAEEEQREEAALRARIEPIVEMMQIKGESECRNGMFEVLGEPDELCGFEKNRDFGQPDLEDCGEGKGEGAQQGKGCTSRLDYVRYALTEGLREEKRIGVNPYRFGFVGSTDSHNGTPGIADELRPEKFGMSVEFALTVGGKRRSPAFWNPGGLAGVWAEENSRDALFDGMKRREAFATSGPRIAPRFFGGWDLPKDICQQPSVAASGYQHGVPMGGILPPASADAPTFVVSALRDPGTEALPGGLLQRLQIIKGWVDEEGRFHQQVVDVAGTPENGASVDLASCEATGSGHDSLCGTWTDPDFDIEKEAVYYARVIENPSCRWTTRLCNTLDPGDRPDGCDHPTLPKTIQERAWTSPIWHSPTQTGPTTALR